MAKNKAAHLDVLERVREMFWSLGTHAAPITSDDWTKACYAMVDPDTLRNLLFDVHECLSAERAKGNSAARKLVPFPKSFGDRMRALEESAQDAQPAGHESRSPNPVPPSRQAVKPLGIIP